MQYLKLILHLGTRWRRKPPRHDREDQRSPETPAQSRLAHSMNTSFVPKKSRKACRRLATLILGTNAWHVCTQGDTFRCLSGSSIRQAPNPHPPSHQLQGSGMPGEEVMPAMRRISAYCSSVSGEITRRTLRRNLTLFSAGFCFNSASETCRGSRSMARKSTT